MASVRSQSTVGAKKGNDPVVNALDSIIDVKLDKVQIDKIADFP